MTSVYISHTTLSNYAHVGANETLKEYTPFNKTTLPRTKSPQTLELMFEILMQYHLYGYPVVLTVGSIGNALSYFTFTRTRFKKVSSIQYLAAIAVSDTGFLWTFIFNPLYRYHNISLIVHAGICQFMMFLNYVFTFLSIWYLAAMVIEKFIGVYWPLKKGSMCTPFRAKLVMWFMAAVAVACYSYIGYFFGPEKVQGILQCIPWKELRVHFENLSKIDTFVVAVIPYGIILLLTSLIVIRGCEYYRISAAVDLWPRQNGNSNTDTPTSVHVTQILFPVIIVTMMSNLPVMILRALITLTGLQNQELGKWNQIFYELYILNFSVKGFVYMFFSSSFRRRNTEMLKGGWDRIKHLCEGESSVCDSTPQRIHLEAMTHDGLPEAGLMQSDT